MKKYILWITFLIILSISVSVQASTKTYERTEDDLKIHSSIRVTEKVKKAALATPKVDASEKIYDFAELFSLSQEKDLYDNVMEYINKTNMDMVIVTIDNNNKSSSEAYADDFYDYNDFGKEPNFDGILFLIDMDERMMYISTTGRAISVYNDYRIDSMLDAAYNYIINNFYYEAADNFIYNANRYAIGHTSSSDQNNFYENNDFYVEDPYDIKSDAKEGKILFSIIFSIICTCIFVIVTKSKHKLVKKATHAKEYLIKNSIQITRKDDIFIRTNTAKVYNPPSSSSGGSSSHRSSSGRSHGGGGRRF